MRIGRKHIAYIIGAVMVLLLILWGIWCYIGFRNTRSEKSRVTIERQAWYELEIDGKPVLYYTLADSDSIFKDLAERRDTAITRTIASAQWTNKHWWWPSCKGRITTMLDTLDQETFSPQDVVSINLEKAEQRLHDLDQMSDEMEYFFSVHSVQDEGYELVTEFYEKTISEMSELSGVITQLKKCQEAPTLTINHKALYRAIYKNKEGKQQIDTCLLVNQQPFDVDKFEQDGFLTTLQLKSKKTPSSAKVVSSGFGSDINFTGLSYAVQPRYVAKEDTLDGFGLKVTPQKGVQLGQWKNNKYIGEQVEYNSQRIYGIDISRFQHEKGKRRYSINWNKLRITNLGTISKKKVKGTVNYKVSFIYIKATEGKSVKNKYYSNDYSQAKKHGLKVGNYHFFSTKSSGALQAKWYLKHSYHRSGDLPPVLDLEPTAAQIRAIGGPTKLFAQVRVWLRAVKAATGKKPILYISQSFVNKYLSYAPDLKQNYQVWIARYGEYKPDVHMVYWQLSPDGRVEGIKTKVDINVFNGYESKYEEFIGGLK